MSFDNSETAADDNWPIRQVQDATSLRALAHPLRIRLAQLLAVRGPATATELAELVDQSPANCSWHLRQLAAGGFIEQVAGGKGRQRIWRFAPSGHSFRSSDADNDPELAEAADMASAIELEHEAGELRAWRAREHAEPAEWRDAAFTNQSILWLTPAETNEIGEYLKELFVRGVRRNFEPEARPDGARPVRLYAWAVPAINLEPAVEDTAPGTPDSPPPPGA